MESGENPEQSGYCIGRIDQWRKCIITYNFDICKDGIKPNGYYGKTVVKSVYDNYYKPGETVHMIMDYIVKYKN